MTTLMFIIKDGYQSHKVNFLILIIELLVIPLVNTTQMTKTVLPTTLKSYLFEIVNDPKKIVLIIVSTFNFKFNLFLFTEPCAIQPILQVPLQVPELPGSCQPIGTEQPRSWAKGEQLDSLGSSLAILTACSHNAQCMLLVGERFLHVFLDLVPDFLLHPTADSDQCLLLIQLRLASWCFWAFEQKHNPDHHWRVFVCLERKNKKRVICHQPY